MSSSLHSIVEALNASHTPFEYDEGEQHVKTTLSLGFANRFVSFKEKEESTHVLIDVFHRIPPESMEAMKRLCAAVNKSIFIVGTLAMFENDLGWHICWTGWLDDLSNVSALRRRLDEILMQIDAVGEFVTEKRRLPYEVDLFIFSLGQEQNIYLS